MAMGGGTPQDSLLTSAYNAEKRLFMKLINDIRATGASAVIDLPVICVIGNQSCGKPSLIEAISGINLPRAADTCTRCPTEVRLQETPKDAWKCVIKLRREQDESGNVRVEHRQRGNSDTIWVVEDAIRRAQLAILNPSVDYLQFVDYKIPREAEKLPLGSKKQLSFSKNVVCLEISGPKVTDLTLIDLPGLIKNVGEGEDPNSIAIIEDLVRSYIKKDCLILSTITMTDDINNQHAAMLAKEYDIDGKRTIGVLTKVDRVPVADTPNWIKMLRGQREKLHHGYFITRQPGTDELEAKITFEDARKKEALFFQTSEPWRDLDHAARQRCGTKSLTTYLSNQLIAFIKHKLPFLLRNINDVNDEVERALREMPAQPSEDPSSEMLRLVTAFQDEVTGYTNGTYLHKDLVQEVLSVYAEYKYQIRMTTPLYTPYTKAEIAEDSSKGVGYHYMSLLKDIGTSQDALDAPATQDKPQQVKRPHSSPVPGKPAINLDDVRRQIESAITWELPGNVPWDVKLEQIAKVTSPWKSITLDVLGKVKPIIDATLREVVSGTFGRYGQTLLAATVQSCVDNEVSKLAESTRKALEHTITLDTRPYTQNDHYLMTVCDKVFAALSERRCPPVASSGVSDRSSLVSNALAALSGLGYRVKEDDLQKLNTPSEWEREFRVMAEIRAYFQVAYKRIIDAVPTTITAKFIEPLSNTIYEALLMQLAISTPEGRDRCKHYLSESEDVTGRRSQLEEQRKNLKAAQEAVYRFQRPTGM